MDGDVETESFDCMATIRVKVNEKYIVTILKLADRYEPLTAENLKDSLLPHQSIKMAENIIERYKTLGFIDDFGMLTELGKLAVEGEVYMPESGKYTICTTKNGFFPNPVVKISRINSNENKENTMKKPEILKVINPKPILVLLDGQKEEIIIETIENQVQQSNSKDNFSIEVRSSGRYWNVNLKEHGKYHYEFQNSKLQIDDVWREITETKNLEWRGHPLQNGFALLAYKDTNINERKTFTRNIPKLTLNLDEFGTMEVRPITVNIQPLSQRDADLWSKDVIIDRINDFTTVDNLKKISEEVKTKFKDHIPKNPDLDDLTKEMYNASLINKKGVPKEYWYLQAPIDLSMEVE